MTSPFDTGLLRYLSEDQLRAIRSVRIGIGGAGGLGSNCAMVLVRSGFDKLIIVDEDVIDASNLNRQQYFVHEIGQVKVDVLKQRLLDINPDAEIIVNARHWDEDAGQDMFPDCRFMVEAFDKAEWKSRFINYYADRCDAVISGNGMAGLTHKQPMTVRKIGHIYFVGDRSTDSAEGHPPMAPRVTACAAMMAEIVLDLTLGFNREQTSP